MNNDNQIAVEISEAWMKRQRLRIRMIVIALAIMIIRGLVWLVLNLLLRNAAQTSFGSQLIGILNMNYTIWYIPFIVAIVLFWSGVLLSNNFVGRPNISYLREGIAKIVFVLVVVFGVIGAILYTVMKIDQTTGSETYTYGGAFMLLIMFCMLNIVPVVVTLVQGICSLRRARIGVV